MPPLHQVRASLGLSQCFLAARAGVPQVTIAQIEVACRVPRRAIVRRIAAVLQVELAEIDEFRPAPDRVRRR
jgi:predicted transcriptional regulator